MLYENKKGILVNDKALLQTALYIFQRTYSICMTTKYSCIYITRRPL